jgi:hypothetical protein
VRKISILIFLFFIILNKVATQVIEASVDKRRVSVGEVFLLKLLIRDDAVSQFTPPRMADFEVISGPNRMISEQILNGKVSKSFALNYELRAKREGNFEIAGAEMRQGKNVWKQTTPLVVEVGKPAKTGATQNDASKDVFVKAEVHTTQLTVGQQVIIDYKIYSSISLRSVNLISEPSYQGFFRQPLTEIDRNDVVTNIGGKRFMVRSLGSVAIFGQQLGKIALEPLQIQAYVVKNGDTRDPFGISLQAIEAVRLIANSLEFEVNTPPTSGVPADFSGIVGALEATASISKTTASTDEALTLRLTIRSNSDPKRLVAPQLLPQDGFEFYEPKLVSERTTENGGEIWTTKEFDYIVLLKKAGALVLQPHFSYFEPEKKAFLSANLSSFPLQISQGTNPTATISASETTRGALASLKTVWSGSDTGGGGGTLFWTLVLLPFMALALAGFWRERQMRLSKIDEKTRLKMQAERIVTQRFRLADSLVGKPDLAFFEEISKALYSYLGNKFGLQPSEYSIENIEKTLQDSEIPSKLIQNFEQILQRCEMARFGGNVKNDTTERKKILENAMKTIEQIEDILEEKDNKK